MKTIYAPGCGLIAYKPKLVEKLEYFLVKEGLIDGMHLTCCHFDPEAEEETVIVNNCPGCDRRFRNLYENVSTVPLWKVLADSDFPFPDYGGQTMSIHDACPVKGVPEVHDSVRELCKKMNINIVEPEFNRENSHCCGGQNADVGGPIEITREMANARAAEMPCEDVVVYCAGCANNLSLADGIKPRYLIDLLFEEETTARPGGDFLMIGKPREN